MARLSRIAPEIPVSNLRTSLEYYKEKLGFRVATELADYAIVERDGVAIHLFRNAVQPSSTVGVHIFTPDLDELHAEFQSRGAQISQDIVRKPWGNREFRVKDASGNDIKFTEPIAAE
jgi:uncharacterized glyoxalase superfamily protein PhnB